KSVRVPTGLSTARSTPQLLLTPRLVKRAVMAASATILVRFRRFRHFLIFEHRPSPDRLAFALSLGILLSAGVGARLLLHYDPADPTLESAFLAGLIDGPYAGVIVRARGGVPPLFHYEVAAPLFAIRCGFAGGGRGEIWPLDCSWRFSPFFFVTLPRRAWQMLRSLKVDWQVVLLLAPIGLEGIRQWVGWRFHGQLFYLSPAPWSLAWFAL